MVKFWLRKLRKSQKGSFSVNIPKDAVKLLNLSEGDQLKIVLINGVLVVAKR